jgi:hypothetical protein
LVGRVIKEAHGSPLHSEEILRRVKELGGTTNAKDPVGVIDLVAGTLMRESHAPIERVGPRTFRWVSSSDNGRAEEVAEVLRE